MTLTFYYSPLCPRCRRVGKHLDDLLAPEARRRVRRVDVLHQPLRSWRAGVRMIPALACGDELLSGLVLDRDRITAFLAHHHLIDIPDTAKRL
ncbi:hypothetical protein [Desulfofustis glycolicus]|uniref:Glutaredoxin n=1 Tax=Desulfofustis glycolicus DSM 9705 TaxID=1121409 RepID=A0A1M5W8V4_9BACT|nr:hypothetical protein [Desulfofustis glycolicus]MCB2217342.1 hypothetical protein [Desulfobulbaceae bacterium]SHH84009.1 hypothetical protein SAMN02745124_02166 [Desulfofustis glycolicus DSM 9705]